MDLKELENLIEGLCEAMALSCEKLGVDVDPENFTKAELCMFVLYLISDEGSFDEKELSLIEEAAQYRLNRDSWDEVLELGRVDCEEHYLSQPPETIKFMVEMDNALYEVGEDFGCVSAVMEVYKYVGKLFVNFKGFADDGRMERYRRFLEVVDAYQKENSLALRVKPKGVPAPKKIIE